MTGSAKDTRRDMWRLARRLYAYAGRHLWIVFTMLGIMLFLAVVDRSRAYLIKPLLDNIDLAKAEFVTCAECSHASPYDENLKFCPKCSDSLEAEAATRTVRPADWNTLTLIAYFGIGLSLLIFPLKWGRIWFANLLTQTVLHDMRNDISRHLLRLPLRYYHDRRAGDLISRVSNDTAVMQNSLNFLLEDAFIQPLYLLAAIGLVMMANWQLGLVAIVFFPIYAIPMARLGRAMRKSRKKSLERLGDLTESLTQMYGGIRVVKAFGREAEERERIEAHNRGFLDKIMKTVKKKALAESIVEVFISLGFAAMILLGGYLLVSESMSHGDMALFALGLAMINTPIKELVKGYGRFQESLAAATRIFEILDAEPEMPDPEDAVSMDGVHESVEYKDVTFAYNTEPVLQSVNLRAEPGQLIALVGRSGSGKSTMLDLLCRYYDPQKGGIEIDGHDIRKIKRESVRAQVGVVAQDTFLFNTTIGENIRYGLKGATQEQVVEAAKAAMIHEFIESLENGYDTVVGERGAKMSGGQRQRVAIARAILRQPAILVLDEATSALDTEAEKHVQDALNNLIRTRGTKGLTFVIAHRLSTVREADRIVVLNEGKIVEVGSHDDLLRNEGVYAQLHKLQFELD